MIEDVLDYVKCEMVTYCLSDNIGKNSVVQKYGLIECSSKPVTHEEDDNELR